MSTKDKTLQPLRPHAYAQLFPEYSDQDFQKLVTDIEEKGLRVPVTTIEGENGELLVLDGVNRQKAAFEAGVEPT
jgi:ParB-like chromosome segregation protein Spo0J